MSLDSILYLFDKGLMMYVNVTKYFLFFMMFTLCSFGAADTRKTAADAEVKDTIVVRGMVLYGQVTNFGPERLSFKLLYSEGINHIAYKDIESINTEHTYHISFKRIDIEGRVVAIEDNEYIKVMEGENERTIKIADIDNFVMSEIDDSSFENRIRNKFPYTKGSIHIGLENESGSSDKNNVDVVMKLRHKQAEHEILFYIDYEFETTETPTTPEVESEDELVAALIYRNHFKNNQYYYASILGDYDRPRQIKNRYIPAVGYGYRFRLDKSRWIEPSIGLAYATTKYTGDEYSDKNFAAAALGLEGKYQFDDLSYINTLIVDGRILYFPRLDDASADWISRANLNFSVPLFDFFSVRLAFGWINDSNPDPNVGNNKETTKLLFGLDF